VGEYFEREYGGSFLGLNVQKPEIYLDPAETPSCSNFWFRNSELRSCPPFAQVFLGPDPVDPPLGQISFLDANNVIHTCSFTANLGLWQLSPFNNYTAKNPWTLVGTPGVNASVPVTTALLPGVPVASQAFANILYYTNGTPFVFSWDGIANLPILVSGLTSATFGGAGSSIGAQFMYELNSQICLLNITLYNASQVASNPIPGGVALPANSISTYPQLLWYSANGLPNQYDPTVNTSAGFVNFLEVADLLTGVMAMGDLAYIFRSNGITQQTIGGSANQPFIFDHLWASKNGVGNVYPWSIAQYGSIGMCVSTEQIYMISINSFSPIGGGARDAIIGDLAKATLKPVASIIPSYAYGFIYLTYRISIPMGSFTRHYTYAIEDKNWFQEDTPGIIVTGQATTVWR